MTLKIQSDIDYEQVCLELGISMDVLMSLSTSQQITHKHNNISFLKVTDEFIEYVEVLVKNNKRSKTTLTTYKNFIDRIKIYISDNHPEMKLVEFNEIILNKFFSTLIPRNKKKYCNTVMANENIKEVASLSNYTTNKYIAIVRKLYKFAYTVDYIDRDLSYRFESNKVPLLPRYFQIDQLKAIIKFSLRRTYGYRWQAMVCFMLGTGCRIHEITKLKVEDIDFENDLLKINGKGGKDRVVPIYPELKKIMFKYFKTSNLSNITDCKGYVFSRDEDNTRNIKISDRSLQYQVTNILRDANIDQSHFSTHSFRHTFSVNCLKAGMKIEYLSQLLGHSNPATTSIYLQLLPVDLRDEIMKKYPFPFEAILREIF